MDKPLPTYLILIHSILTLLWFSLHLSWSCLTFYCSNLIILIFSTSRQDGFHTLESYIYEIYDIYLYAPVIICVVFSGAYMRCTRLCSLNPGVTEVVSEEMLTVGRNLDRNGQTLTYLSHSDSFYTYLDPVSPSTVLLWSFLPFLLWDKMDFTPWNPTIITFLRDRRPKTKSKLFSLF